MTFITVLGVILAFIVGMALIVWPLFVWVPIFDALDNLSLRFKILNTIACIVALAALITICIAIFPGDDRSSHCGPGTRYISESHLIGKTVITDWACIAS